MGGRRRSRANEQPRALAPPPAGPQPTKVDVEVKRVEGGCGIEISLTVKPGVSSRKPKLGNDRKVRNEPGVWF